MKFDDSDVVGGTNGHVGHFRTKLTHRPTGLSAVGVHKGPHSAYLIAYNQLRKRVEKHGETLAFAGKVKYSDVLRLCIEPKMRKIRLNGDYTMSPSSNQTFGKFGGRKAELLAFDELVGRSNQNQTLTLKADTSEARKYISEVLAELTNTDVKSADETLESKADAYYAQWDICRKWFIKGVEGKYYLDVEAMKYEVCAHFHIDPY